MKRDFFQNFSGLFGGGSKSFVSHLFSEIEGKVSSLVDDYIVTRNVVTKEEFDMLQKLTFDNMEEIQSLKKQVEELREKLGYQPHNNNEETTYSGR